MNLLLTEVKIVLIYQLLVTLLVFGSIDNETTLRARITKKCFQFLEIVLKTTLKDEAKSAQLPSKTISTSSGSVDITNQKVQSFDCTDVSLNSLEPNDLTLVSEGCSLQVTGSWNAQIDAFFFYLYPAGDLVAEISDIKMFTQVSIVSHSGRPHLKQVNCQLKIGKVDLHLYGGLMGWILNQFTGKATSSIKEAMNREVCENVQNVIVKVNKWLWSRDMREQFTDNVYFKYQLLGNPKATKDFIEFNFLAHLAYKEGKCFSRANRIDDTQTVSDRMIILWLGEPMLNCYLKTWFEVKEDNNMQITINTNDQRFNDLFSTNCMETGSKCDISGISGIKLNNLNHSIDLDIYLTKEPNLNVKKDIYQEVKLQLDFYQAPRKSNSSKLGELTLRVRTLLKITLKQQSLNIQAEKGAITLTPLNLIGEIHQTLPNSLTGIIEEALSKMSLLKYKFDLPKIDSDLLSNVKFSDNATFIGREGYIRSELDFVKY